MVNLLMKKQQDNMNKSKINNDRIEKDKLQKFEMNKMLIDQMAVKHEYQQIDEDVELEEPEEYNQVTKRMVYDIANALNEHVAALRKDNTWNKKNKQKFDKLKTLLN